MKIIENNIEYDVEEYYEYSGAGRSAHKAWYYKGLPHRELEPAIESFNGDKSWFKHGKCHREDGPAIIYSNGKVAYYLNGIYYPNVNSSEELQLEVNNLIIKEIIE